MSEKAFYIGELIKKQLQGELSEIEQAALNEWLSASENNRIVFNMLNDEKWITGELKKFDRFDEKKSRETFRKNQGAKVRRIFSWTRVAAAVIIVLLLSLGGYFYFNNRNEKQIAKTETQQQRFKNDIAPGGNKAVLTLANGTQIILDSAANGTLTQQGNAKVIKLDSGQLAYTSTSLSTSEVLYNTISTPRGGQYQIVLADGSKVWLNAASSLKYPTSFTGKERNVELTGEGYFEIAHNATMPFRVRVNDMNVEVFGTHFNINAYDDENIIRTTLLEGSVKVTKGNSTGLLKPGQQGQLNESGDIKISNDTDLDEVMAWKEGRFLFKRTDIQSIMRQLSRWYNIDIVYKNVPATGFNAKIPRNTSVSNILKVLELTGEVKFIIEGNIVTVMQ